MLSTEEFSVPALDAEGQLYLRNKVAADSTAFSPDRTLLFVHGATYPSETVFDLALGGLSWMDYIASRGYDVYCLDIRGYGRSARPAVMAGPAELGRPLSTTEEASRDIEAAVGFILRRRGISRLNLLGWSWGTTTTALFTTRHPDQVARLALHAPVWTMPAGAGDPEPPPQDAYRCITIESARERWFRGVPAEKRATLVPAGWFDTWARAFLDSDPEGARRDPPAVRAPNGVLADICGSWLRGKRLYDASQIRCPTLIVKGEWDVDTPAAMAAGLFRELTRVPYKSYVEIGEATHMLMLEKNRMQLFRTVQAFLDEPAP